MEIVHESLPPLGSLWCFQIDRGKAWILFEYAFSRVLVVRIVMMVFLRHHRGLAAYVLLEGSWMLRLQTTHVNDFSDGLLPA